MPWWVINFLHLAAEGESHRERYRIFKNSVVMCDDKASFAESKCMTYIKGCAISVAFSMKVRGGGHHL